jgi:hypothetical protein
MDTVIVADPHTPLLEGTVREFELPYSESIAVLRALTDLGFVTWRQRNVSGNMRTVEYFMAQPDSDEGVRIVVMERTRRKFLVSVLADNSSDQEAIAERLLQPPQ